MNEKSLKRISTWGKVIGIIMMITGTIWAISGFLALVIGAFPGVLTAYMGYLVFKTGKDAQEFLTKQSEDSVANLLDNYAKYLFIQGILLIVSLVVMVMFFVAGVSILGAFI